MRTLELRKELEYLCAPSAKAVALVEVPAFRFAMIDGEIAGGTKPADSTGFQEAIQALYGISLTLEFELKRRASDPVAYPVMPLEGLWRTDSGTFEPWRKDAMRFTLMILQPDVVTEGEFSAARTALRRKRGDTPALAMLRLELFREGLCKQTMHVGPYSTEPGTLARMAAFAREQGYRACGAHHEIYMGDPRRSAPAKLRTILRLPIARDWAAWPPARRFRLLTSAPAGTARPPGSSSRRCGAHRRTSS